MKLLKLELNKLKREKEPLQVELSAANLLSDDDHKLWLSSKRNSNFPQTLIIDLT